ncbi:hypothetical protein RRG08_059566, partial [Elysia crispata]
SGELTLQIPLYPMHLFESRFNYSNITRSSRSSPVRASRDRQSRATLSTSIPVLEPFVKQLGDDDQIGVRTAIDPKMSRPVLSSGSRKNS